MAKNSRHMRVNVCPEHYISVAKHQIVRSLLGRFEDDQTREKFQAFCQLIEAVYHFEYHRLANELKEDFSLFQPGADRRQLNQLDSFEIAQAEERFLTNFRRMMSKGNFRPLTQADLDVAEAEEYLFNLPVTVDWEKLDQQLLTDYFRTHPYLDGGQPNDGTSPGEASSSTGESPMPEFAHRILIYRRGVGVDQTVGFFPLQKIDILVSKLLILIWWLFAPLWIWFKLFGRKRPIKPQVSASLPAQNEKGQHIHEERYIERITLRSLGINSFSFLWRTRIQEPTFKELVILFRFAAPTSTRPEEKDRAIHIKMFREIPMADLEVIFPEKKISMQPLDLVQLAITTMVGVIVVMFKLVFTAVISPVIALVMLASIVGYALKVLAGFKGAKDRYQHLVTHSLYHKNLDNDLGVVHYLMDALEEQEFKEAVLGYFILLTSQSGPMTVEELDQHCERYLNEKFGIEVDFEVEDALGKLVRDGLVERRGAGYAAVPLREALRRLDHKWDNYFQYNVERNDAPSVDEAT